MEIIKATADDIELLIKLRKDMIIMDYDSIDETLEALVDAQLNAYFPKHFALGDFVAYYIKIDGEVAAAAFMIIIEKLAYPNVVNGLMASINNVLTYPKFRRRGLATILMKKLIDEARNLGVSSIELYATDNGKKLYETLGFKGIRATCMQLSLTKAD